VKEAQKNNTAVNPLLGRFPKGKERSSMGRLTVYGIPGCDNTKKALSLLKKNKIVFSFHDYKQQGISKAKLEAWCKILGWETIFNKRSTTWRELNETEQKKVTGQDAAIKIMMEHNSIIKRPLIEIYENLIAGFNETEITKHLNFKK
jgi:Spx/MgsR family transcriptional regulator